jgi:hypothetical protein
VSQRRTSASPGEIFVGRKLCVARRNASGLDEVVAWATSAETQ